MARYLILSYGVKTKELKLSQKEELQNLLAQKKEGLQNFYFASSKGKIKNVKEARNLKKDIAKILTLLRNV